MAKLKVNIGINYSGKRANPGAIIDEKELPEKVVKQFLKDGVLSRQRGKGGEK